MRAARAPAQKAPKRRAPSLAVLHPWLAVPLSQSARKKPCKKEGEILACRALLITGFTKVIPL